MCIDACPKMNVPQDKKQVISNHMVQKKTRETPTFTWPPNMRTTLICKRTIWKVSLMLLASTWSFFLPVHLSFSLQNNVMRNCQSDEDGLIIISTRPFFKYPNIMISLVLVWPVPLAPVWTHYKIGKVNMWTSFCNVCIDFWNSQIWKEIMLEFNGKPSKAFKCYHVLNWFFLPKPGFLEFIWIFSCRNHLKINISHILNPNLIK